MNLIHKSFADYILGMEHGTPGTFRVNLPWVNDQLSRRSIDRMTLGLRKNICNVADPLMLSGEFDQYVVAKSIPPDLAYACTYWIHHLEESRDSLNLARTFLETNLLHWLEVLSILGERAFDKGGAGIRTLLTLAQLCYSANPYS